MLNGTRTPYSQLPITMVQKAIRQKAYRQLHCLECGFPFAEITDKVVTVMDFAGAVELLHPDRIGIVGAYCPRKQCQQRYRFEFAM